MMYYAKFLFVLILTVFLDNFIRLIFPITPDLIHAGFETAALVIGSIAAAASATTGTASFFESRKARRGQEELEKQRKAELANEANARAAAKSRAATGGRRAGASTRGSLTGFGFGTGNVSSPTPRGTLFGN